jgi:two-component system, response regulator
MADTALQPLVMIAEDDADDRLMMTEAFAERCPDCRLCFAHDGAQLMRLLGNEALPDERADWSEERPDLVLLDLNMPLLDGREALRRIKADPALRQLPTVVMTTSANEDDVRFCYDAGANSYIVKPTSYSELLEIVSALNRYWIKTVALPQKLQRLQKRERYD